MDWSQFVGHEDFRPEKAEAVLLELVNLHRAPQSGASYFSSIVHKVIGAIGDDHSGAYYPAIIAAGPLLIRIAATGAEPSRRAALAVLDNLCATFWADTTGYTRHTSAEVDSIFLSQLVAFVPLLQEQSDAGARGPAALLELIAERRTRRH